VIEDMQAALGAGEEIGRLKAAGKVHRVVENGYPFIVGPNGEAKGVEQFLPAPVAQRASVVLHDVVSFMTYVNRFKDADSVLFADLNARKIEAILDYHKQADSAARWGKHRAAFTCATTPEWNTWVASNGKAMSQVDFARFIENNIPNIAEPAGAVLLEMCRTLEVKKDVQFRQSTRLQDGQHQIRYEETIEGRAGGGTQGGALQVPNGFVLALVPFVKLSPAPADLKRLDARFRFRLQEGHLTLSYELVRHEDVLRAAFDDVIEEVISFAGNTPVLAGVAPTIA
jgi:uncharacterized protein YfdQ (DUF2303 family)